MKGHSIRWFLIGFGIVVAAGVAGWFVAACRRGQFDVDEAAAAAAVVDAADRQPVP